MKKLLIISIFTSSICAMDAQQQGTTGFAQSMASRSFREIIMRAAPIKVNDEKALKALLQELLNNGADINEIDDHGATPLMYAASVGNKNLYRWLVHRGADGKICSSSGKKAYHYAPARWNINEISFEGESSEDNEELNNPETYDGDQCWFL